MHHAIILPEDNIDLHFFWIPFQTTSLDLPLKVSTFNEAILNIFSYGVSWFDDLVGPHLKHLPTLP